ncbi:MAG: MerR family transcriptional regulator [Solirubrobacterales bacterium]
MSATTLGGRTGSAELLQIGEVAEEVGLSLRTVRYYEEVGVLAAPARTEGGFRLYGTDHLEQLRLIKQMKPLGLSLDEMRELLRARETLRGAGGVDERARARARLEGFAELAGERCRELRGQLRSAERFARQIGSEAEAED